MNTYAGTSITLKWSMSDVINSSTYANKLATGENWKISAESHRTVLHYHPLNIFTEQIRTNELKRNQITFVASCNEIISHGTVPHTEQATSYKFLCFKEAAEMSHLPEADGNQEERLCNRPP